MAVSEVYHSQGNSEINIFHWFRLRASHDSNNFLYTELLGVSPPQSKVQGVTGVSVTQTADWRHD